MQQQNPYNQPPMGQMPQTGQPMMTPPMQPPMPPRGQWRQRAMSTIRRVENISFPKWLSIYPIVTYILALMVVSFMYSEYSLPWYYMLSGIIAVLANER